MEHLPGLLTLVSGMPVVLTQNIAIELGLTNGMNGIFRQLVYEIHYVSYADLSQTVPSTTDEIERLDRLFIETQYRFPQYLKLFLSLCTFRFYFSTIPFLTNYYCCS